MHHLHNHQSNCIFLYYDCINLDYYILMMNAQSGSCSPYSPMRSHRDSTVASNQDRSNWKYSYTLIRSHMFLFHYNLMDKMSELLVPTAVLAAAARVVVPCHPTHALCLPIFHYFLFQSVCCKRANVVRVPPKICFY